MALPSVDPYYFSKQAKRIQDQLDELHNEPHLDNLSKQSFNSSRKHDTESIPTYAETKYLVDNGFNADLPRGNNSTTNMAIDSSHVQHVMPCYAQVNKTRRGSTVATEILCVDKQKEVSVSDPLYSEIGESASPKTRTNIATLNCLVKKLEQKKVFVGSDGTVYEAVSGERTRSKPQKKQLNCQSLYADVDHTMKPPAPPPRNYGLNNRNA